MAAEATIPGMGGAEAPPGFEQVLAAAPKKSQPKAPPPRRAEDAPKVEEGLPMWMATFCDMVTLLLCFFVLLLSFAKQDVNKFKSLMGSIKSAFGVQLKREEADFAAYSPTKFERDSVKLDETNREQLSMVLSLKSAMDVDEGMKRSAKVSTEKDGVVMRVETEVLFGPGRADLMDTAEPILAKVIDTLKQQNYNLVVRGHTDDVPPKGSIYPSNWELSSARAAAALRRIMEKGEISSTRLKAVGYADSMPLVPNTDDKNRKINRRMEFFFHKPTDDSW